MAPSGVGQHGHHPDSLRHAPAADHLLGDAGGLLEVVLGAGGDVVVDEFLGGPAGQHPGDAAAQVAGAVGVAVGVGGLEGDPEGVAAGHDRDLADRVGAGGQHAEQGVAGLVVGGAPAVLGREQDPTLAAEHDLLQGVGEVGLLHLGVVTARRQQRRLVDQVGQVGPDHARGGRGDRVQVDIGGQGHAADVHGSGGGRPGRAG